MGILKKKIIKPLNFASYGWYYSKRFKGIIKGGFNPPFLLHNLSQRLKQLGMDYYWVRGLFSHPPWAVCQDITFFPSLMSISNPLGKLNCHLWSCLKQHISILYYWSQSSILNRSVKLVWSCFRFDNLSGAANIAASVKRPSCLCHNLFKLTHWSRET